MTTSTNNKLEAFRDSIKAASKAEGQWLDILKTQSLPQAGKYTNAVIANLIDREQWSEREVLAAYLLNAIDQFGIADMDCAFRELLVSETHRELLDFFKRTFVYLGGFHLNYTNESKSLPTSRHGRNELTPDRMIIPYLLKLVAISEGSVTPETYEFEHFTYEDALEHAKDLTVIFANGTIVEGKDVDLFETAFKASVLDISITPDDLEFDYINYAKAHFELDPRCLYESA